MCTYTLTGSLEHALSHTHMHTAARSRGLLCVPGSPMNWVRDLHYAVFFFFFFLGKVASGIKQLWSRGQERMGFNSPPRILQLTGLGPAGWMGHPSCSRVWGSPFPSGAS